MPQRVLAIQSRDSENGSIESFQNLRNREFRRFLGEYVSTLCTSHTGHQASFLHGVEYLLQKSCRYPLPSGDGFCLYRCGSCLHGKVDRRQDSICRSKRYLHTTVFRSELRKGYVYLLLSCAVKMPGRVRFGRVPLFWVCALKYLIGVLMMHRSSQIDIYRTQVGLLIILNHARNPITTRTRTSEH